MPGALDGVRVLDLSWGIAGPLGVLLLAEQGADVIKVEPPGGDPFRDYSGYAVWNRSRRSVTIDLKQPRGRRRVPPARRRRRRARRDVPARRHRPARHRLRRAARAQPPPRLPLVPGVPRGPPPRATRPGYDALVQASSGQQWEQPGWRLGPDLPAHADAEHGRDVPRAHRHPRRAHRAGDDRPRPARAHVAVPGRAALHDADLARTSSSAPPAFHGHGQDATRPACTRR